MSCDNGFSHRISFYPLRLHYLLFYQSGHLLYNISRCLSAQHDSDSYSDSHSHPDPDSGPCWFILLFLHTFSHIFLTLTFRKKGDI